MDTTATVGRRVAVPEGYGEKRCPRCGSEDTWLIQGNEFIIKEIAVPDG